MILAKAKLAFASQLESTKWVSDPIFWRQQNVASIQLTSWANSCKKSLIARKISLLPPELRADPGRSPIILYNQHLDINQNKTQIAGQKHRPPRTLSPRPALAHAPLLVFWSLDSSSRKSHSLNYFITKFRLNPPTEKISNLIDWISNDALLSPSSHINSKKVSLSSNFLQNNGSFVVIFS